MVFNITDDGKFLVLVDSTAIEYEQLQFSFTKKWDDWYIIKKKRPYLNPEEKFIDQYNRVPLGLWHEVQLLCEKYNFQLHINNIEKLYNKEFVEDDYINWLNEHFPNKENFYPYDFQREGARRALKFGNCVEEISTSGGKTVMAYMIFKYLWEKKLIKKALIIVPRIDLVGQTEEKFYLYEDKTNHKPDWVSRSLFSGVKKNDLDKVSVLFGTYQTLTKLDAEFYKDFDLVIVDEVHHAQCYSIKTILLKCINAKYKIGITGSLPNPSLKPHSSFVIQAYLGAHIYTYTSNELISDGKGTPVKVIGIELDYLDIDLKKKLYELRCNKTEDQDGVKLLNLEKQIARENRKRLLYICDTIKNTTKNSLVLFSDIKYEYGKNIYNWLRENTEKSAYYIDGGVKIDNRDYYKERMEQDENVILIASVGTFSEGIDIENIHNVFVVESNKSEYIVRQILGRPMRLKDGKAFVTVLDFSDNFVYGNNQYQKKNYLIRHADERQRIYNEKKFPYKRFRVKL
jgi:superfamily II DNA or RNA helicase